MATAVAYGILTDTLDLYRAHRPDVVQTYLSVLQQADMKVLARIQNPQAVRRNALAGLRRSRSRPGEGVLAMD